MRTTWTFHSAGQLLFGRVATGRLGEVAVSLNIRRLLLVTDPVLMQAGLVDPVLGPLSEAGVTVELFTGGEPEPSLRAAYNAISAGRDFRPDAVLGLGGGSNMDLAKITATVLTHGGTPSMYVGDGKVPGPIMPLLCLPTTAGTGSEVSAAAVLTDTENHMKVGVLSNYLRPRVARGRSAADAELSGQGDGRQRHRRADARHRGLHCRGQRDVFRCRPGERTVYQGRHPFGDMLAEKAIALVGQHLRKARADGQDLEAREGMALAATLAGMAFSNVGVAVVHALEYPVGGATHCSHGAGNGLLLPYVMRYNLPGRETRACPHRHAARRGRCGIGRDRRGREGDHGRGETAGGHRHSDAVEPTGREGEPVAAVRREGVRDQAHPARQSARGDAGGAGGDLAGGAVTQAAEPVLRHRHPGRCPDLQARP